MPTLLYEDRVAASAPPNLKGGPGLAPALRATLAQHQRVSTLANTTSLPVIRELCTANSGAVLLCRNGINSDGDVVRRDGNGSVADPVLAVRVVASPNSFHRDGTAELGLAFFNLDFFYVFPKRCHPEIARFLHPAQFPVRESISRVRSQLTQPKIYVKEGVSESILIG